jgi:hypothetical protein
MTLVSSRGMGAKNVVMYNSMSDSALISLKGPNWVLLSGRLARTWVLPRKKEIKLEYNLKEYLRKYWDHYSFIYGNHFTHFKPEFCSSTVVANNTKPVAVQWQITF